MQLISFSNSNAVLSWLTAEASGHDKMRKVHNGETSSNQKTTVPKPEMLDFDFPSDFIYSSQLGETAASSSASDVRSFLTGMGFLPSLVDKVIQENGEDNVDLLLEILMECSDPQKSNSQSSDSLDTLFNDKDASNPPEYSKFGQPKEEPDVFGFDDSKRASLLHMNFSAEEVDFAMEKLGTDAPVDEIVDFITAAQVAANFDEERDDELEHDVEQNKYCSRHSRMNPSHVARGGESFNMEIRDEQRRDSYGRKKPENLSQEAVSRSSNLNLEEIHRGKRPKQEYTEGYSNTQDEHFGFEENYEEEGPKPEYTADSSFSFESAWVEEKVDTEITGFRIPREPKFKSCKSVDRMVAKPPYFLYGNVATVSLDTWGKISQFLYAVEPEFVNTQFFSALSRKEGYVHNLPTENRFHILPKPPMSILDAMPHIKKWWPSWDTRKQLSFINYETNGLSQLCDRLGRMLTDSRGLISSQQKRDILHHCHKLNLVWVGLHKVRPIEPEHLELILGYPLNHTQTTEGSLTERLHALRYSFQIDTLGYHLSVLKSMFPEGITVLSLFSGIGGAEVALHRLGIHMKGVVSVETSETKRKILRMWWRNSGQTGELEQIEDIQKLTTKKIDRLIERFGGFDFVICQSPCTCASGNPKMEQRADARSALDFSLFCEFVRVLQRVRTQVQRKR
ncbi:conserved hypothetical protein [Ricinus communis]|uniref:DNA (cytosine-5-)-methyltransferase n=1 Tax=Ricinus communis TaxID=3988 RepID=B9RZX5_RICCO|nr:conserved hypothetical protein [Ricinus communis]